jgi:hypothetical protein
MESAETQWSALASHSPAGVGATRGIDAHVCLSAGGLLEFRYVLRGAISRLRVPPAKPAERAADLWKHTCFEAFVRQSGATAYHELNFSPSREWAVYRFDAYRTGVSPGRFKSAPQISTRHLGDRLEVDAAVRLQDIVDAPGRLQIGLSAVVEDENGTLSYWALRHPAGKPDFHHADGFALQLMA